MERLAHLKVTKSRNPKIMANMTLTYDGDVNASLDDIRKTGIIEGQAIGSSVNLNCWQVPEEDLDYFASTL